MKVCFKEQADEKTVLSYLPCCVIWLDEIFNFNKNPVFNTHIHTYTLYICICKMSIIYFTSVMFWIFIIEFKL